MKSIDYKAKLADVYHYEEVAPGLFNTSLDKSSGVPFDDIVVLKAPRRVYKGKGKKRVFGDQFPVNVRDQISHVLENH